MIIVTGATGFIGRRVVALLVKKYKPSSILCLVWARNNDMEIEGRQILIDLGVKMKKIDLVTRKGLGTLLKTPRIVIHLAGNTDTNSSDYSCNDKGTKNLLKYLQKIGPQTHLIHISTTAIMSGRPNAKKSFSEKAFPIPGNRYSVSKLRAEEMVKNAWKDKKFKLTILRYPTVYGKEPKKNSFFDFVGKLIQKNSPFIRLNWSGLTSFVHVDDAAKAVLLVAEKPPKNGQMEVFNVSTESITLQKISQMMYKRMGYRYQQIKLPVLFWKSAALFRPIIYKTENYLPPKIYNLFWRASLLVDNVIFCDASKLEKKFPNWRPDTLSKRLDDVIPEQLEKTSRIEQEIKHFSNLEHIWIGQITPAGQKRYDNKASLLKKYCRPNKGDKILEIGCGDGVFTRRLKGLRARIVASDITPAVINRAKETISFPNLFYKVENCEKLSFKKETFSIVCGISILHHVNIRKTLQESYRVLKKGGKVFFTEPNLINPIIYSATNIQWLRERMELSPQEKALLRWQVAKMLKEIGFKKVVVRNYDFLLPWAPEYMISPLEKLGNILERIPLVKEISGSLLIYAEK